MNVAVLGASDKPERYSYQAVKMLAQAGHKVFPIHPSLPAIDGQAVFRQLSDVQAPIDVLTLYVGPSLSAELAPAILAARPKLVIFNPGAENPSLAQLLDAACIRYQYACTLVLLRTGQFGSVAS